MKIANAIRLLRDDPSALRGAVERMAVAQPVVERAIARQFHRLYYYSSERTFSDTHWMGVSVKKCPFDLWVYQELLSEVRPDVLVETGTRYGGSARYFASLFDLLGTGRVITVDIDPEASRTPHDRITYLEGSSTADDVVAQIKGAIGPGERVLAILDSDHSYAHVRDELAIYGELVSPGSYLVVEDSNINGHPVYPEFGPGPMEAIDEFLANGAPFDVDPTREKFFVTFNPRGFLRKREP